MIPINVTQSEKEKVNNYELIYLELLTQKKQRIYPLEKDILLTLNSM